MMLIIIEKRIKQTKALSNKSRMRMFGTNIKMKWVYLQVKSF